MQTASASTRGCAVTESLAAQAMAWGYPREITKREIDEAAWVTSPLGILWFEQADTRVSLPEGLEGALFIHGIGNPKRDGQALSPETARLIEKLGAELGAKKLYALNGPVSMRAIRRYLRRYGWIEDEWGTYKVLGGFRDG